MSHGADRPYCWIYAFDSNRRLGVKIGICTHSCLNQRLGAARQFSRCKKTAFDRLWHIPHHAADIEDYVKAHFKDRRVHGEWYRVSLDEMAAYVDKQYEFHKNSPPAYRGRNAPPRVACTEGEPGEEVRPVYGRRGTVFEARQEAAH